MVELCYDYGFGEVDTGLVKLESNPIGITSEKNEFQNQINRKNNDRRRTQDFEGNLSSSTGQSDSYILDQERSLFDDSSPCPTSAICAAPICRQFWGAGVFNESLTPVSKTHAGSSYLHVHPKFLHSNATSHKWAFGAIAELLDNAVDEIQNGATYVIIDKTTNPRNGSPALLVQDDGAGMDPEAMRKCLSFGFSDKKSESAIGKYGNGFKTSSMRLGADALVFTRTLVDQTLTQSIGLLSYTFLTRSGYDRIVVPMVHYKYNFITGSFESLQPKSDEQSNSNLSVLLQWSPYSTEKELLKQFDDIGSHGTKIIVYNLWLDDDGKMELDFESDPEDIRLGYDEKSNANDNSKKAISENHIANRLRYSLREYLSILYLRLPETFCIVLRRKLVLYHNIATDLKHPEFILYKPQSGGSNKGGVVTTIGFLKEAPHVKVHGFNIYHKHRLILPFLPVVSFSNSRGRGIVGVLEANFIEPTHSKQDFEKTDVFQKLVTRLKLMTLEYWDYHCGLIGYKIPKKALPPLASPGSSSFTQPPTPLTKTAAAVSCPKKGSNLKRKLPDQPEGYPSESLMIMTSGLNMDQKKTILMQENKKLKRLSLECEKAEEEFNLKVMHLKTELQEAQKDFAALLTELQVLEKVKGEN